MGLVSRVIEEAGIPTVTLNMLWPLQRAIGMSRVAAIEHPFGRPYGDVGDVATQGAVLDAALALATDAKTAGTVTHLPFRWHEAPEDTDWHPKEPSPIIGLMKERQKKKS